MEWLNTIYKMVWGVPMLILLMGNGLYLTFALRGIQFSYLFHALKLVIFHKNEKDAKGDISNFESLMTALAGSIGIGNIAGVATALSVGGLGALFWMWVMAWIGMATKYAEAILAVKYREVDDKGEICGGPMYFIEKGLGWKWLATSFAFFGSIAAFGGGNLIQANSVADVVNSLFGIDALWTGLVLAAVIALILIGGIKSIAKVAVYLVPFMAIFYITGGGIILIKCYDKIPHGIFLIIKHAFTEQAAFGGFLGSTMFMGLRVGLSRGLMTSEAGLGTTSIVAAAAKTDEPGRQAMVSMTGSFIATIVLCSVTGLALAVTGVMGSFGPDGKVLQGASMTMKAFESQIPYGGYIVLIGLVLFAVTTILGWAYYGEKCLEYMLGTRATFFYRIIFTLVIIPGAMFDLEVVWKIADITNGLMAYPNLIGISALSYIVVNETKSYLKTIKTERLPEPAA